MLTSSGFAFIHFEVYSIDSSKMINDSHEVFSFNRLFLKLNYSSSFVTNWHFSLALVSLVLFAWEEIEIVVSN